MADEGVVVVYLQCASGKRCLVMGGFGGLMVVGLDGSDVLGSRSDIPLGSVSHQEVCSVLIGAETTLSE